MKPFFVLIITFVGSLFVLKQLYAVWDFRLSDNIAMSVMLLFTAVGHFVYTRGMEMMLPSVIPLKSTVVYLTGIIEIAAAVGLLVPSVQQVTATLLILFFILILPCNIYAAVKKVDYQKANLNGHGTGYLWFRVPLQFLFIGWVYFFNFYNR